MCAHLRSQSKCLVPCRRNAQVRWCGDVRHSLFWDAQDLSEDFFAGSSEELGTGDDPPPLSNEEAVQMSIEWDSVSQRKLVY